MSKLKFSLLLSGFWCRLDIGRACYALTASASDDVDDSLYRSDHRKNYHALRAYIATIAHIPTWSALASSEMRL